MSPRFSDNVPSYTMYNNVATISPTPAQPHWEPGPRAPVGAPWWQIGPQRPLLIVKGNDRVDLALTKRFSGFDSPLVLVPSHTKMVVVNACMPLSMKFEPQNITGQPGISIIRLECGGGGGGQSMWAYETLSQ